MSRRRRALLLGALATALGTLAASDVARREADLRERIGPLRPVVVARGAIAQGAAIGAGQLAIRRVPARFLGPGTFESAEQVQGARTASAVPAGAFIVDAELASDSGGGGLPIRPGERVADVVASGSPDSIRPGGRVDVLVTRQQDGGGGRTSLALEDVEVLAARAAGGEDASGDGGGAAGDGSGAGEKVAASLRVTARQAVFLAAAQSFAREVRLLPRAPGDHRHGLAGTAFGADLGG